MDQDRLRAIAAWLVDGARSATRSEDVLGELCDQLLAAGVPLARVAVFVRTLHPELMGRRFLWRPGAGVDAVAAPAGMVDTAEYQDSPVAWVYAAGRTLRRRLADPGCPMDFPVLQEFRAEGLTDYYAAPLVFTDGALHATSWMTTRPEGFEDEQIAAIDTILLPLARVAEVRALRRTAVNLLDTYVGHHAGARILAGQIRRGHTERIRAAIWLSDMRGFTTLADRLAPETLMQLLNAYFDCQVSPILENGGEVLKFMGDGLLAIFALPEGTATPEEACLRALGAAREARGKVQELAAGGGPASSLRFGLALHLGEVLYGNIGGAGRLDFTCIGPAVNLAARLEKVAGALGRSIVASQDFSGHCAGALVCLGDFKLPGFAEPRAVFGLPEESASQRPAGQS